MELDFKVSHGIRSVSHVVREGTRGALAAAITHVISTGRNRAQTTLGVISEWLACTESSKSPSLRGRAERGHGSHGYYAQ